MVARRSLSAGVLAVCLVGAVTLGGDRPAPALADDESDPGSEEPAAPAFEPPVVGPQGEARFSAAPTDVGAVAFDDLSGIEQEATDQAAELLEAGQSPESVAGWSAISHQHAELAAQRRAEYEAGLNGLGGDTGVE